MATSTFAAKITNVVGGTIDDDACDDWMTEGAKEIINQLPPNLLKLCTTNTTFTSQAAGSETSASLLNTGKILSVFAGNYSCRKIDNEDKYKAEDSDSILYATATDPVYYIERSYINVLPSGISTSRYEEVQYPTVNNGSDNTIALFPDEAESLVVLYAAIRQLLQYQSTMSTSWNSDITTALGAIATELNKADNIIDTAHTKVGTYYTDIAELENADLWDDTNKRFDEVKLSLENAMSLIGFTTTGDKYAAAYDLEANMLDIDTEIGNEDTELAGARMSQAQTQMNAVTTHLSTAQAQMSEIGLLIQKHSLPLAGVPQYISTASGYISQAAGYVGEAGARLQQDSAKYQWYGDQYAKLSAEYARGLAVIKGTTGGGGA